MINFLYRFLIFSKGLFWIAIAISVEIGNFIIKVTICES